MNNNTNNSNSNSNNKPSTNFINSIINNLTTSFSSTIFGYSSNSSNSTHDYNKRLNNNNKLNYRSKTINKSYKKRPHIRQDEVCLIIFILYVLFVYTHV